MASLQSSDTNSSDIHKPDRAGAGWPCREAAPRAETRPRSAKQSPGRQQKQYSDCCRARADQNGLFMFAVSNFLARRPGAAAPTGEHVQGTEDNDQWSEKDPHPYDPQLVREVDVGISHVERLCGCMKPDRQLAISWAFQAMR